MTIFIRHGDEFVVNTTTAGNQSASNVLALADGRFIVDWASSPIVGNPSQTEAQLFAGTGTRTGGELALAHAPRVQLAGGGFVAVAIDGGTVVGQLFDAALSPKGSPVTLSGANATTRSAAAVAPLKGGGFVATWIEQNGPAGGTLVGQAFDAAGSATADAFIIGDTAGLVTRNQLATLTDGHVVSARATSAGVEWEVLYADGSSASNATIASANGDFRVAALHDGGFVIVWQKITPGFPASGTQLHAQTFSATGAAGPDIVVDPFGGKAGFDVAGLADGGFAVVSTAPDPGDIRFGNVTVSLYGADGIQLLGETVNSTTLGSQFAPSVAALAGGGFVVSWTDGSMTAPDTSGTAVRAQVFDAVVPIVGTSGADTLTGTDNADVIEGKGGDDRIDGRGGIDFASYDHAGSAVTVSLATSGAQNTRGAGIDTLKGIENLIGSAFNDTLTGNGGPNRLEGGAGNDRLNGGHGNDVLVGGDGNDVLIGGAAADTMSGGKGNDTYHVDSIRDIVREALPDGNDTIVTSVTLTLPAYVENLTAAAGTAPVALTGTELANTITGNAGNNVINGNGGSDRLTGGAGADTFVFGKVSNGPLLDNGPARILDFAAGEDHLRLSHTAFAQLHKGALADADLALGPKATTAHQHLVYDQHTGALFYDADGAGGQAQVKIAVLLGHPALTAHDIDIIAL